MYQRILIATALASTLLAGSATACSHDNQTKQKHHSGSMQAKGDHEPVHKHFVKKVVAAVSKTGISAAQAKKVTDAINTFKMAKMQLKQNPPLPLDAFKDEGFDKARFTEILLTRPTATATAKGDLLESIYGILDTEQRKLFTREFTAPMIEKMIKRGMMKGQMMKQGRSCGGKGGNCGGKGGSRR
jgi:hypothetical protein